MHGTVRGLFGGTEPDICRIQHAEFNMHGTLRGLSVESKMHGIGYYCFMHVEFYRLLVFSP